LYESGKSKAATAAYRQAVTLRGNIPLLRVGYAQSLLRYAEDPDAEQMAAITEAIANLRGAMVGKEKENPDLWYTLGIAYGKIGRMAESYEALAESQMQRGDTGMALRYAKQAKAHMRDCTDTACASVAQRIADIEAITDEKSKIKKSSDTQTGTKSDS
jgi:predicted Zn-dependent protease